MSSIRRIILLWIAAALFGIGYGQYCIARSVLSREEAEEYLGRRETEHGIEVASPRSFLGTWELLEIGPDAGSLDAALAIGEIGDLSRALIEWKHCDRETPSRMRIGMFSRGSQVNVSDFQVRIAVVHGSTVFAYYDYNRDGLLDEKAVLFLGPHRVHNSIRIGSRWVEAAWEEPSEDLSERRWLVARWERPVLVEFDNDSGEWIELDEAEE